MEQVVFCKERAVKKIDGDVISFLKNKAKQGGKFRMCLHKDEEDGLHEMIIVHTKAEYIRPHKHVNKTETFHMIEGELMVLVFDDSGKIVERFVISAESRKCFIFRLARDRWHTIIPLTDVVVFHEITNGPFNGIDDSIFPEWEDAFQKMRQNVEILLCSMEE